HFLRQQNTAGAGSESGLGLDKLLKRAEKAIALQKLQKGCRFAAGNDKAVDLSQLLSLANQHRLRARLTQGIGMGVKIALNGEHAENWPSRQPLRVATSAGRGFGR